MNTINEEISKGLHNILLTHSDDNLQLEEARNTLIAEIADLFQKTCYPEVWELTHPNEDISSATIGETTKENKW